HLVNPVTERLLQLHVDALNLATFPALALFLLAILQLSGFRQAFFDAARLVYRLVRAVLVDLPGWLLRLDLVRAFLRSRFFILLRRHVLSPLVLTGLIWLVLALLGRERRPSWLGTTTIFLSLSLLLNSR